MWTVISLFIGLLCILIPPTYSHGGTDESNRKFSEYAPLSPLKGGHSNGTVDRIVGGTPAQKNDPWVGIVRNHNRFSNHTNSFCEGSLIHEMFVLTAAHCLDNKQPFNVRIGGEDFSSINEDGAIEVGVSQMIMHEKYDPETHNNDIGLIKLAEAVSNTPSHHPIHLPDKSNKFTNIDGHLAVVTGYRSIHGWGVYNGILLQAQVPIVPRETCLKSYPLMNENTFCAGYEQGGRDKCQGNSGGSLTIQGDGRDGNNGTWYLVGITSYGEGCGRPGYLGVYTNVSAYLDWIKNHIDHD